MGPTHPPHSSQHLLSPHHGSRHTLSSLLWCGVASAITSPWGGVAGLGPLLPPHPHTCCGECCAGAHGGIGTTAPLTTGPAEASGTLNPLCKVLCILQSLYLCAIGPTLVFCLARDTPCTSNCSPKPLYSWIQATAPWGPWHTGRTYGTVSLCGEPFQGTSWHHRPPRGSHLLLSPQHHLDPTIADCTCHRGTGQ